MKAILKPTETKGCIATSFSGKLEIEVMHDTKYDFMYSNTDEFYIIVDDIIYLEQSTAFDFVEG